ncbi:MAG TPA: DUF1697 domain-containing protein [Candidatus Methylacidiphilales bacterium]|nr:DUF1697 domain-containing protein [Candidatus Methylacidiphilales bacterium]
MFTYAALFRGVNVSGKNRVEMPRLQKLFANLGFSKAETYVQSGNVIFCAANGDDATEVQKRIIKAVDKEFEVNVPVLVVSGDILERVNSDNPYLKEGRDSTHLHFTFLAATAATSEPGWSAPSEEIVAKLDKLAAKSGDDTYRVSPYGLYICCPNGYGRTQLNNNALERALKCVATTRNWKTTAALLARATALGAE